MAVGCWNSNSCTARSSSACSPKVLKPVLFDPACTVCRVPELFISILIKTSPAVHVFRDVGRGRLNDRNTRSDHAGSNIMEGGGSVTHYGRSGTSTDVYVHVHVHVYGDGGHCAYRRCSRPGRGQQDGRRAGSVHVNVTVNVNVHVRHLAP